ncbi:MAG: 3-dehydroquinate synthase [Lachnospiraceae bacterium]|nr:3-dehydroquinate synthase [Lachnospiraceae bacterium]
MGTLRVELKKVVDDSYDIEIGYKLSDKLIEDIKNGLAGNVHRFAVITDSIVEKLYGKDILDKLIAAGFDADIFVFEEGEKSKTRQTKAMIEDAMLEKGYRRDCCIIAVGGGVVTDLAGFIAGTYGRGVPFINYATTLLAAADASVGGKTAIDTPLATNLIGLFNQPNKVYIDIATWETLPQREVISGLAETIKHACIADREFFDYLNDNIDAILAMDKIACEHIAEINCKVKYEVVMKDERESGLREVLNLGHTVGRAIETVSDYKLLHGEAVSIGLVAEVLLANKLSYVSDEEKDAVIKLLDKAGLPTTIPDYIDKEALVKKLYTDKKVRDGKLRFVLQKGIGDVVEFESGVFAKPISEEEAREIVMSI